MIPCYHATDLVDQFTCTFKSTGKIEFIESVDRRNVYSKPACCKPLMDGLIQRVDL